MITIAQATSIIADQYSESPVAEGLSYAEEIGYQDTYEFFAIAMAKILYSEADLKDGARYPVEQGSLEEYFAQ